MPFFRKRWGPSFLGGTKGMAPRAEGPLLPGTPDTCHHDRGPVWGTGTELRDSGPASRAPLGSGGVTARGPLTLFAWAALAAVSRTLCNWTHWPSRLCQPLPAVTTCSSPPPTPPSHCPRAQTGGVWTAGCHTRPMSRQDGGAPLTSGCVLGDRGGRAAGGQGRAVAPCVPHAWHCLGTHPRRLF